MACIVQIGKESHCLGQNSQIYQIDGLDIIVTPFGAIVKNEDGSKPIEVRLSDKVTHGRVNVFGVSPEIIIRR